MLRRTILFYAVILQDWLTVQRLQWEDITEFESNNVDDCAMFHTSFSFFPSSIQPQEDVNEILDKHKQKTLYDKYIEERGAVIKQEIIPIETNKETKPTIPKKRNLQQLLKENKN